MLKRGQAFILSILVVSVVAFAVHGQTQNPQEEIPEMVALGAIEDTLSNVKDIAEGGAIPIPEGALDGAKTSDLMYQTLKLIFGQPIANISLYTTNADPSGNTDAVDNVNVIVFMFSLMAGIGLLATLVAAIWTILESLVSISTSAKLFNNGGTNEGSPFAFFVSRVGISSLINVPIPAAGGMSLSQVFMLLMALLGIGCGSALFSVVANRMINQPLITYSSMDTELFFISSAQAVLCLEYLEKNEFIEPESNVITFTETGPINMYDGSGYVGTGGLGNSNTIVNKVNFGRDGECGSFEFNHVHQQPVITSPSSGMFDWLFGFFKQSSGDNVIEQIDSIFKPAAMEAAKNLFNNKDFRESIKSLMDEKFAGDGYKPSNLNLTRLATSYATYKDDLKQVFYDLDQSVNSCPSNSATVSNASGSSLGCSNQIVRDSISQYGFMLAGTYTYVLNERQSVLSGAIERAVPKYVFDEDVALNRFSIDSSAEYLLEYKNKQRMLQTMFGAIASHTTGSLSKDLNKLYEATTSDSGIAEALGDTLYSSMRAIVKVGYMGQESSFQNPEPITQLSQIGNMMMAVPFAVVLADKVGSFIGKMTPAGLLTTGAKQISGKIKSASTSGTLDIVFSMMLAAAMQAVVVGGFFLAVFVPAIPYIMWNMAIFGYLSYILLVVIGVPIMVAAKPLKDGDGFVGGVKTGYMMAFTVFIRPSAMVIGLVAAMVLSRVFSWIINATYFESMQIAYSNGFNLGAVFGVPLMYSVLQLTAIYKAYSMVNEVPAFIGKMTETDRAHSDFGEEGERNRVGGLFLQSGNAAMGGMHKARKLA